MKKLYVFSGVAALVAVLLFFFFRSRKTNTETLTTQANGNTVPTTANSPAGYPFLSTFIVATVKGKAARTKCMGNIRDNGDPWQGRVGADAGFVAFSDWAYGTRATLVTLRTYINKHNRNTITQIINAYAPPTENLTLGYIDSVSKNSGIGKDTTLTIADLPKIASAMFIVECGIPQTYYNDLKVHCENVTTYFKL